MGLIHIMDSRESSKALFFFYKNRYLIIYTIIGFFSLALEQFIIQVLDNYIKTSFTNTLLGFLFGVLFAFIFNAKFNFRVPRNRLLRSLIYFFFISLISFAVQNQVKSFLNLDMGLDRYIISGFLFFFFYILHKMISFKTRKKVGLAIHLNNSQSIKKIYNKVGNYPDFIHVDLIDETFNINNISTNLGILDEILETWPKKVVQLHLMSSNHHFWIEKLEKYSNKVKLFIHDDSGKLIKRLKKQFPDIDISIVVTENSDFKDDLLKDLNEIICLCIKNPGYSGQNYQYSMDKIIQNYVSLKNKYNFKITLDGGVTNKIASKFDVDNFVSASYVLDSNNSRKKIIDLQTANKYINNE
jgi:pentose-5-phosphate-3-epimerase/putative flippase GtrA